MRYHSGRARWKRIKRMARSGAVEAFQSWVRMDSQYREIAARQGEAIAYAICGRYLADRAAAVRMARPVINRDEAAFIAQAARHAVAKSGIEMTQEQFEATLDNAAETVRSKMEAKGTPMPTHPDAIRELLRWMYKVGEQQST